MCPELEDGNHGQLHSNITYDKEEEYGDGSIIGVIIKLKKTKTINKLDPRNIYLDSFSI